MSDKTELDELRSELAAVKKQLSGTDWPSEKEVGEWRNQMHAIAEARMSRASAFSRADLAAFEAAAPTSVVKDITLRDARGPLTYCSPGPPSNTPRTPVSNVERPVPTGWARETPLGPPPGLRWVDRQLDAQDAKDRRELMVQKAKEAILGTTEPK